MYSLKVEKTFSGVWRVFYINVALGVTVLQCGPALNNHNSFKAAPAKLNVTIFIDKRSVLWPQTTKGICTWNKHVD